MKYLRELREQFKKTPIFTSRDIEIFFTKKGLTKKYLHLLLHNLVKKGEIFRIRKGIYTFNTELTSVGFAFSPFYYGLQEALSIHGIWEQETIPVVVTVRKVRTGRQEFEGSNYLVRRISRKMFFGFDFVSYSGMFVPVSDIEKTLIDLVYFREPLSKEVLKELNKRIDQKKLKKYLSRAPRYVREKLVKLA
jgi:predicted transcriptional regulator of viral defense system